MGIEVTNPINKFADMPSLVDSNGVDCFDQPECVAAFEVNSAGNSNSNCEVNFENLQPSSTKDYKNYNEQMSLKEKQTVRTRLRS